MGDQSDTTYSNILLENVDSDIPIALNFTTPPKVTQAKENQAADELSNRKSSSIISGTGRYTDEKYDTINLRQLLCEISAVFRHCDVVAIALYENTYVL